MVRSSATACALLLAFSWGCGGGDDEGSSGSEFPAESYATLVSDHGRFRMSVWTSPQQPPSRGQIAVKLSIADAASGEPMRDLELEVVPWMPTMGHGTAIVPTVSDEGDGTYVVEHVNLFMPGRWELRTEFKDGVEDRAVPLFDIP